MKPTISVIIPFYNTESTIIKRCLESISSQTFEDYEIILVNDGSTNEAITICKEHASLNTKITILHKSNGGLSSARNYGLDHANGKYIVFLDSDDIVEKDYLESLYKGKDCDLSFIGINKYNLETNKTEDFIQFKSEEIINIPSEIGSKKIIEYDLLAIGFAWGKLYKRDIIEINHIRFDERIKIMHEDHLFYYDYLIHCKSIYLSKAICYNYTYQSNSASLSHTVPPYKILLISSDGFMNRYPILLKKMGITSTKYIKRITTEYGIGTRRSAVYSLYYYHNAITERISFLKEQSEVFRYLYRKYGYNPPKIKHYLVYMLICTKYLPAKIKDIVLKTIYNS